MKPTLVPINPNTLATTIWTVLEPLLSRTYKLVWSDSWPTEINPNEIVVYGMLKSKAPGGASPQGPTFRSTFIVDNVVYMQYEQTYRSIIEFSIFTSNPDQAQELSWAIEKSLPYLSPLIRTNFIGYPPLQIYFNKYEEFPNSELRRVPEGIYFSRLTLSLENGVIFTIQQPSIGLVDVTGEIVTKIEKFIDLEIISTGNIDSISTGDENYTVVDIAEVRVSNLNGTGFMKAEYGLDYLVSGDVTKKIEWLKGGLRPQNGEAFKVDLIVGFKII